MSSSTIGSNEPGDLQTHEVPADGGGVPAGEDAGRILAGSSATQVPPGGPVGGPMGQQDGTTQNGTTRNGMTERATTT